MSNSATGLRRRRMPGCRRAAAAAELALLLPLLVTIALACVDLGRLFYMNIAVANAARAGAGVGSFNPISAQSMGNWHAAIRTAALEEMSQQTGFDPQRLTIGTPVVTTDGSGFSRLRFRVTYRFNSLINWILLPTEVELGHTVEMAVIR